MKKANRILSLFAAMIICFLLSVDAAAQSGSITVILNSVDDAVGEGSIPVSLYRVAEFDGSVYTLNDQFSGAGITVESLCDADAEKLYAFALSHELSADKKTVKTESCAVFDVAQGVYLVSSKEDENGVYKAFKPFLVWLPYSSDDGQTLLYDIKCEPKLELIPTPQPTAAKEIDPTVPTQAPYVDDTVSKLPQTGMLWWPVLLMSMLGIVIFALGWAMRFAFSHE